MAAHRGAFLKESLRDFWRRRRRGPMAVMVALSRPKPEEACLERLRGLGLRVEGVIGNKLVGEIAEEALPGLEGDPDVLEVEVTRRLRKHGP